MCKYAAISGKCSLAAGPAECSVQQVERERVMLQIESATICKKLKKEAFVACWEGCDVQQNLR